MLFIFGFFVIILSNCVNCKDKNQAVKLFDDELTTVSTKAFSQSASTTTVMIAQGLINGYVDGKFYCHGKLIEKENLASWPKKQKCGEVWYSDGIPLLEKSSKDEL